MASSSGMSVKVGIFVVVAVVVLIGFSLRVSESGAREPRYRVAAFFENAVGLEKDSQVTVGGVRVGEVSDLSFDAQRRKVRATLSLVRSVPLPPDSVARVDKAALLGKSIVVIRYGQQTGALADGGEIPTEEIPGLSEIAVKVSETSDEIKVFVADFNKNQNGILGDLKAMIDENRKDIRTSTEALADAGPKLRELAENLNRIGEDMAAGKGTLGQLFTDQSLYDDLRASTADLREFTRDIREKEGTLHRLVYDDSLAKKAEESFQKVGDAGEEIRILLQDHRSGLEKFFDAGPKIEQAAADLSDLSQRLKESDGTLGKLINDPSLYNDAQRAVNQVNQSFESSEEQGVIRSFIGVLFGALI